MLSEIRSQKDKYTSTHSSLYGGSLNQLLHIPMDDSTQRYSNLKPKKKKKVGEGDTGRGGWGGEFNCRQPERFLLLHQKRRDFCVCVNSLFPASLPLPSRGTAPCPSPIPRLRPRCQAQHRGLNTSPLQILLRSREYFLLCRNKSLNGSLVNSSGTYSSS